MGKMSFSIDDGLEDCVRKASYEVFRGKQGGLSIIANEALRMWCREKGYI